jgi:hypothetical protein
VKDRWKKCVGLLTGGVFRYEGDMGADKTKIDDGQALQGAASVGEAGEPAGGRQVTEADRRRERAAQKLRENLSRRKQQVRARRAGQADETDGLPAAKAGDSADAAAKRDESQ